MGDGGGLVFGVIGVGCGDVGDVVEGVVGCCCYVV